MREYNEALVRKLEDRNLDLERAREEFPLAHLLAGRVLIGRGDSEKARAEIQTYLSMERDEGNRALATGWLDRIESERKGAAVLP